MMTSPSSPPLALQSKKSQRFCPSCLGLLRQQTLRTLWHCLTRLVRAREPLCLSQKILGSTRKSERARESGKKSGAGKQPAASAPFPSRTSSSLASLTMPHVSAFHRRLRLLLAERLGLVPAVSISPVAAGHAVERFTRERARDPKSTR